MKLKLAQLLLNMLDNFLSITISGRGQLASYLYRREYPSMSQIIRKYAKRHGIKVIELKS